MVVCPPDISSIESASGIKLLFKSGNQKARHFNAASGLTAHCDFELQRYSETYGISIDPCIQQHFDSLNIILHLFAEKSIKISLLA